MASDAMGVLVESPKLRDDELQEVVVERSAPRAFDCVELPSGVSTTGSSEAAVGGLQRLWEGGLFDVSEHTDVALHTACCPWHTFGTNMERSGFGTSWAQGGIFFLLAIGAVCFYITFACTGSPWYIYGTASLILLIAIYAGHYRARIRRRFNIIGSEGDDVVSTIDDHLYHLMCGCCSLCQEARTLQHNNVQNGVWHGRGDILVIGSQVVFSPSGAPDLALAYGMRRHNKTITLKPAALPLEPPEPGAPEDPSWTEQLPLIKHG